MEYTRKVGRSWLAAYAVERPGTGLLGRTCARPTGYAVRHLASRNGNGQTLGVFDTLAQAREYIDGYSLTLGLLT